MRPVKASRLIFLAAAVLCLTLGAASAVSAEDKAPQTDQAAQINSQPIFMVEYNRELARMQRQAFQKGMPTAEQLRNMQLTAMNNLINAELLYQAAEKSGVKITPEQVDEEIKKIKQQLAGEDKFKAFLESENMTEADAKRSVHRSLVIQQFINQEVQAKIKVTDKELQDFYDKNPKQFLEPPSIRASHILIKVEPGESQEKRAEVRKKIESLLEKVKQGADFAELAKQYSEDASNVKGGDLGYFKRGLMVKPFEQAAFALEKGQVSDIVETLFGFHIIKVTDKKTNATIPLEKVKDKLTEFIKREKTKTSVNQLLVTLRAQSKIEILMKGN
ncbi:MAG: peptidylprolyl isomerase [Pseudomonadota bacterium]